MRIALEIAVSTPEEAASAVRAGADRLELSAGLEIGGLTPSLGTFERVRDLVDVPVWVLLRPRAGGFIYTAEVIEVIARDAQLFLDAGADGIVFGALDDAGRVAEDACLRIVERARGRIAFHRAFDFTTNPHEALEQLVRLGFTRVLTSGGKPTAREGSPAIAERLEWAAGRIEVMPGGGIRPNNVTPIVNATGCRAVHAAPRRAAPDRSLERNAGLAGAMTAPALHTTALDADLVAGLRRELDRLTTMTACPPKLPSRPSSNSP